MLISNVYDYCSLEYFGNGLLEKTVAVNTYSANPTKWCLTIMWSWYLKC